MPERILIRVIGADRIAFFQGMCSADVKAAGVGAVVAALLLTEHARVIADFYAWIAADALLIDVEKSLWAPAHEHLNKLLVADDVEFAEAGTLALIDIAGPKARDAADAVAGSVATTLDEWQHGISGDVLVGRVPRVGIDAYTIVAPRTRVDGIMSRLRQLGGDTREVSEAAVDVVRIENGLARVGVDTNQRTIALEARLDRAIAPGKGCYVGQETIERATARGGLKRRLYGLKIEGTRAPAHDSAVMLAGKEVGRVGSSAVSPRLGAIALSILHHSAWQSGTRVVIKDQDGEASAIVSDLPFGAGTS
jgi:folate-binding protein YgfZ